MSSPSATDLAAIIQKAAPHRRRRVWLYVAGALVVLLVAFLVLGRNRAANLAPPNFVTTPLARGDIHLSITATGNLEPTNEVTVGSELSGLVLEVYVDTNDRVTVGQPLAKLDTTKLAQQTASSRANLQAAQASVAQAEATVRESAAALVRLQELQRLSNGQLPSPTDLDTATAAHDRAAANLLSAQANVAQAEANLRINENDLSKAVIKSPIDGIVLSRQIEPGQTVAASFTAPELFVIAENLEHMKLLVTVAEADIARLQADQTATFTVDAWPDRTYEARVLKVAYGSAVTNNVVTYETELEVANTDLTLRPGMTATADIAVASRENVFLVPAAALRFTPPAAPEGDPATTGAAPKKSFVQSLMPMPPRPTSGSKTTDEPATVLAAPGTSRIWVLRASQPEPVTVSTGLNDGRQTEISAPSLNAGDAIILRTSTTPAR